MNNDPAHNVLEFGFMAGQKVADLGSGSGFYTAALSTVVGPDGRVIAVDREPFSLSRLKKQALFENKNNIEVLRGDIEILGGTNLRAHFLDGAVFSHTFAALGDKHGALTEARRIVKKGGKICLIEKIEGEVRAIAQAAGLVFERMFDAGRGHAGFIFKN